MIHPQLQVQPSSTAKFDLKVIVCSNCSRVIADGEQVTEVTASQLTHTSKQSFEGDFESASQVGSQASFPQWEANAAGEIYSCVCVCFPKYRRFTTLCNRKSEKHKALPYSN